MIPILVNPLPGYDFTNTTICWQGMPSLAGFPQVQLPNPRMGEYALSAKWWRLRLGSRWISEHSNPKNGMLVRGHVQRICLNGTSVLLIWYVSRHETKIQIHQRFRQRIQ